MEHTVGGSVSPGFIRKLSLISEGSQNVPWRTRVLLLALIVGLLCGVVAAVYEWAMDFVLEMVWKEGGAKFAELVSPSWLFILVTCTFFGTLTGVLIRVLGEPVRGEAGSGDSNPTYQLILVCSLRWQMANLPGVVMAAHRDGSLGYSEAPAMAAISISSIVAGGSLGPEAPLVSIGGGLASLVAEVVELSEAETLFVTM